MGRPDVRSLTHFLLPIQNDNPKTLAQTVFRGRPLVVYQRGRNLRDKLVHSYLPPNQTKTGQTILTPVPDGNAAVSAIIL